MARQQCHEYRSIGMGSYIFVSISNPPTIIDVASETVARSYHPSFTHCILGMTLNINIKTSVSTMTKVTAETTVCGTVYGGR